MQDDKQKQEKVWIVQRCINVWKDLNEDWPGYCDKPMTYYGMRKALEECGEKWPRYEFRGHNLSCQIPPGSHQS